MNISEHFSLEEMTFSETAARLGIDNAADPEIVANLKCVAALMEKVRALLGKPITVHSGYRAPRVNEAVGGVATSAHCFGLACDFVCGQYGTAAEVALAILKSELEYDQLILEYGWVHIGLAKEGTRPRREALTKRSPRAPYELGIRAF
ncbi:MAG: D-Ala-D-Ala carboxypeptidase family metallohydrolase [Terriglobales bacterium]|jgi:zinc D-Ala-D-Ala carboxypeptidase